jgi:hypothetical protein
MAKKKIKGIIVEDNLPKTRNNIYKVYIYKRPTKLFLMPIPYKWKLDLKKITEIKNPPIIDGL